MGNVKKKKLNIFSSCVKTKKIQHKSDFFFLHRNVCLHSNVS